MIQKENKLEQFLMSNFKHLMFEIENEEHIVSLVDSKG